MIREVRSQSTIGTLTDLVDKAHGKKYVHSSATARDSGTRVLGCVQMQG